MKNLIEQVLTLDLTNTEINKDTEVITNIVPKIIETYYIETDSNFLLSIIRQSKKIEVYLQSKENKDTNIYIDFKIIHKVSNRNLYKVMSDFIDSKLESEIQKCK